MLCGIWGLTERTALRTWHIGRPETEHVEAHDAVIREDMKLSSDLQVQCSSCFASRCIHSLFSCEIMQYLNSTTIHDRTREAKRFHRVNMMHLVDTSQAISAMLVQASVLAVSS